MRRVWGWRGSARKWLHTIFAQLMIGLAVIIIITVTCSTVIQYRMTSDILTRNYEKTNLGQFQQLAFNLGNMIQESDKINLILGTDSIFQMFLDQPVLESSDDVQNARYIFNMMNQYMENYPYIASIYCFSENGVIMGVDAVNPSNLVLAGKASEQVKNAVNYHSGILESTRRHPNNLACIGGLSSQDFLYYNSKSRNAIPYVTLAKLVAYPLNIKHNVIILINIREDAFRSVYNNAASSENLTYVIDAGNKIVSHPATSLIGNKAEFSAEDLTNKQDGSFISATNHARKQVIYYKINGTNFYIIKETLESAIVEDAQALKTTFMIVLSLSLFVGILFISYFIRRITMPLHALSSSMLEIEKGNLRQYINKSPKNEISTLIRQFNRMSSSIIGLMEKNRRAEEERHQLEMEFLQAQINPHFLYNTLNTLKWMALISNASRVADGLTALGNLLRPLYCSNSLWPMQSEFEFIQNYVLLMNYRFGGSNQVVFDIPSDVLQYHVLTFLLQPILENSFSHGIGATADRVEICVSARVEKEALLIRIVDSGAGIGEEELTKIKASLETNVSVYGRSGIGLSNVHRRIRLRFGAPYGITVDSIQGSGTTVQIVMPLLLQDECSSDSGKENG